MQGSFPPKLKIGRSGHLKGNMLQRPSKRKGEALSIGMSAARPCNSRISLVVRSRSIRPKKITMTTLSTMTARRPAATEIAELAEIPLAFAPLSTFRDSLGRIRPVEIS